MDVKLPQLAEGVEGGTIVSILVAPGDKIKKDQPFMELETQKAVGSIPAPSDGVVSKIHVKEGMEVAVGQLLITIENQAAATEAVAKITPVASREVATPASQPAEPAAAPAEQSTAFRYQSKSGMAPPAPPSIRRMARDLGIDLTRVRGSEPGGRINLADVRNYITALQDSSAAAPTTPPAQSELATKPSTAAVDRIDFTQWGPVRREKLSPLRRTVSRRMVESWTTIPKINQFADANITPLLALRKKYVPAYEKQGAHLTLTSFILFILGRKLKDHPRANSSLDTANLELVYKDYCHIGVAVDTEAGLIVPILRDVDKKNLLQISQELHAVTEKTRARKISMEELQGGTFTISNQGSIGGSHFTPIIYAPQVAILGVGRGEAKPVAVKDKIALRTMLPLCLAYDHRVLDGADAVRFLMDVINGLENFDEAQIKL